jgi:hypothetical protein
MSTEFLADSQTRSYLQSCRIGLVGLGEKQGPRHDCVRLIALKQAHGLVGNVQLIEWVIGGKICQCNPRRRR